MHKEKKISTTELIQILKYSKKETIEIFVRQRLGQDDAVLNISDQPHKSFCFNTITKKEEENNDFIISLFNDIWESQILDNTVPVVRGYKGCLVIGNKNILKKNKNVKEGDFHYKFMYQKLVDDRYASWSTVDVLVEMIISYINLDSYYEKDILCINSKKFSC